MMPPTRVYSLQTKGWWFLEGGGAKVWRLSVVMTSESVRVCVCNYVTYDICGD